MSASPINFQTVVSELLVVFLESDIVHVRGTVHVDSIVHVYGTIHKKQWERSKNFLVQSRGQWCE